MLRVVFLVFSVLLASVLPGHSETGKRVDVGALDMAYAAQAGTYWVARSGELYTNVGGFIRNFGLGQLYKRVAVDPQGVPWVINNTGQILKAKTSLPTPGSSFVTMPGLAQDIGIGTNGAIFVTGFGQGDQALYYWDTSVNYWAHFPTGAGVRIAVDPQGKPWVVNASNEIWRYTGDSWHKVDGTAIDIQVHGAGYTTPFVYIIGTDYLVKRWDGTGWAPVTVYYCSDGFPVSCNFKNIGQVSAIATGWSGLTESHYVAYSSK